MAADTNDPKSQDKTTAGADGSSPSGAAAQSASAALVGQSAFAELNQHMQRLVHKFYPGAKTKLNDTSFHFEFKTKRYDIPQTDTIEQGPDWQGILGDISVKPGRVPAEDEVEQKLNQYSYYHVIVLKPNSPSQDCHLEARLAYPFDVAPEFIQRFKQLCRAFDNMASLPPTQAIEQQ